MPERTKHTLTIWLFDYNEETSELEFHYCDRNEWNGVAATPEQAAKMELEFAKTGRTSWVGEKSEIEFTRGVGPI